MNLNEIVIRVPKENSSFCYFVLESLEGMAFYSTLDDSLQTSYRDIRINYTSEFQNDMTITLERLQAKFPLQVITSFL